MQRITYADRAPSWGALIGALALSACGSAGHSGGADPSAIVPVEDSGTEDAGDGGDAAAALPTEALDPVVAPSPGTWAPLISHEWELEPGQEGYWCKRIQLAENVWVQGLRAVRTLGTHHVLLGVDRGTPGAFRCTGFSTGNNLVFGTGANGGEQTFPEGVAVKLAAGESLLLNLHLYNTGDEPLRGTSVIEVLAVDPADVQHEAALVLAGLAGSLAVPPGESTQTGNCPIRTDTTILAVGPHMHTRGIHEHVSVVPPEAGAATTVFDEDYVFDDQAYRALTPSLFVAAGSRIQVDCTYRNDSLKTLRFGESTNDEMCFAGVYHYPRIANGSICAQ